MPLVFRNRYELREALPWVWKHFPACSALSLGGCPRHPYSPQPIIAHAHPFKAILEGGMICFSIDNLQTFWNPEKPTATFLHEYAHCLNYRREIYDGHVWEWRSEYRRLLREWGWPKEMLFNAWLGSDLINTPAEAAYQRQFEDAGRYPDEKGPVTPDLGLWGKVRASSHSFLSQQRGKTGGTPTLIDIAGVPITGTVHE